jgi:hypothetical protein
VLPHRGSRHARSHCSAAHDVPPVTGRVNNLRRASELDNAIDPGSEGPTGGVRSSRNSTPPVATNYTIEPAGYYGIQRNQTTIAKQVTTVAATRPPVVFMERATAIVPPPLLSVAPNSMTKVGGLVDNVRLASIANSRPSKSTVQRWRGVESGGISQTAVRVTALVNIGFGAGWTTTLLTRTLVPLVRDALWCPNQGVTPWLFTRLCESGERDVGGIAAAEIPRDRDAILGAGLPAGQDTCPRSCNVGKELRAGHDQNRCGATESAQCAPLLSLTTDDCARGLHPSHSRTDHRRW